MQSAHFELLRELGILVDPLDLANPCTPPRSPSPILPNKPHHYDQHGMAVFTAAQLSWARPSDFGFTDDYYVVEEEHSSHPLALNYADEVNLPRKRPVHRYSRMERFKFTLGQLMGCSGHVPPQVLRAMNADHLRTLPSDQVWDAVRSVLKAHKWRIYYNRIPAILAGLGLSPFRYNDTAVFQDILYDFDLMDKIFESLKFKLNRAYFPNLRFTAVKLMRRHGIHPPITIPLARTARKLQALEDIYSIIWCAIEEKKLDDFVNSLAQ